MANMVRKNRNIEVSENVLHQNSPKALRKGGGQTD